MQARLSERERKSLGRKSVNGCWYVLRKKNSCDGRKRIFWPQAEEWAEEYGSSGCIVWYWWCCCCCCCCCCDDENDLPSNEHYLSSSENKAWKKNSGRYGILTGIAEVMGSNPVQALKNLGLYGKIAFIFTSRSSNIWLTYIHWRLFTTSRIYFEPPWTPEKI